MQNIIQLTLGFTFVILGLLGTSTLGHKFSSEAEMHITSDTTKSVVIDKNLAPVMVEDATMQAQLEMRINANPQWKRLVSQKRMSVGLIDMRNPAASKMASLNGDHMMYAASLPKIAVLLASAQALEDGTIDESPEVLQDMRIMISKSNNQATTRMIDRVGFDKISAVLTDPAYNLYDINNGGGLWVGKRYAAGGKRNPDPIKGISHAATSRKVCEFYHMLATDQLITPDRSAQMRQMLVNPELHHKFVNTLDKIAPTAEIHRKSGSWKQFHADSAWVQDESRNYIVVALIEDVNGGTICKSLINAVEDVLAATPIQRNF